MIQQKQNNMRRNLATYGMSWKDRETYRLNRKASIANEKGEKAATIARLMDMVIEIEDAIKPEADRLFANVVAAWKKAHAFVLANGKTWNAVRTAKTGVDIEAEMAKIGPAPLKYARGSYNTWSPEYVAYKEAMKPIEQANAWFNNTLEKDVVAKELYNPSNLLAHAEKEARYIVEANKAKLLDGIARYMGEYQTATVNRKDVKLGAKGFQGEFNLTTDKGPRLFTCKAITAEGPIVSFHWRYIIHVKTL